MGFLPNILPAHPEAPEWLNNKSITRTGLIARALSRLKHATRQRRDLRVLRAVSGRTLRDLGLHRSGLRTAHADRVALTGAPK